MLHCTSCSPINIPVWYRVPLQVLCLIKFDDFSVQEWRVVKIAIAEGDFVLLHRKHLLIGHLGRKIDHKHVELLAQSMELFDVLLWGEELGGDLGHKGDSFEGLNLSLRISGAVFACYVLEVCACVDDEHVDMTLERTVSETHSLQINVIIGDVRTHLACNLVLELRWFV